MVILSAAVAFSTGVALSETPIVKLVVPGPAGVPEMTPPDASKLNPAGKLPALTDHLYGAIPPVAANVVLYEMPDFPSGSDDVVMLSFALI
jgi:glutathione S-transferase